MDPFIAGDVYLDFPYEDVKFRYEKQTGKCTAGFTGRPKSRSHPVQNSTTMPFARARRSRRKNTFGIDDSEGAARVTLKRRQHGR